MLGALDSEGNDVEIDIRDGAWSIDDMIDRESGTWSTPFDSISSEI
jgi:hypothetical protein